MKIITPCKAFVPQFEDCLKEKILVTTGQQDIEDADLIIFTGGEDINPERYGDANKYSIYNSARDELEFGVANFIHRYFSTKKILGVCRGLQLICASYGLHLIQDLYLEEKISHPWQHPLDFHTDHWITKHLMGENVNSMHHQGIKGGNIRYFSIVASWKGVCEVLLSTRDLKNQYVLTQFHPEFMQDKIFFKNIISWVKGEGKDFIVKPIAKKRKTSQEMEQELHEELLRIRAEREFISGADFRNHQNDAGVTYTLVESS